MHTPGPWEVEPEDVGYGPAFSILAANDDVIVHPEGTTIRSDVDWANACLIAAAPELLEALKMLVSYTEACEGMLNASPAGQVTNARAALAKAEGK